jgi:hypothetical protein
MIFLLSNGMPKRPQQTQNRQHAAKKSRQPNQQNVWIRANGTVWALAMDQRTGLKKWVRIK